MADSYAPGGVPAASDGVQLVYSNLDNLGETTTQTIYDEIKGVVNLW